MPALPERPAGRYGQRGRELYCLQDTAAAAQNILLAATSMGLGACWVGSFHEDEASRVLELEHGQRPVVMLPLGYPAIETRVTQRKAVDEIRGGWRCGDC